MEIQKNKRLYLNAFNFPKLVIKVEKLDTCFCKLLLYLGNTRCSNRRLYGIYDPGHILGTFWTILEKLVKSNFEETIKGERVIWSLDMKPWFIALPDDISEKKYWCIRLLQRTRLRTCMQSIIMVSLALLNLFIEKRQQQAQSWNVKTKTVNILHLSTSAVWKYLCVKMGGQQAGSKRQNSFLFFFPVLLFQ